MRTHSWSESTDGFEFRSDAPTCDERAGDVMRSYVLQNVRRRLDRLLTNLVHADCVPAVFTRHKSAARNISSRGVHALRLRFIGGRR